MRCNHTKKKERAKDTIKNHIEEKVIIGFNRSSAVKRNVFTSD